MSSNTIRTRHRGLARRGMTILSALLDPASLPNDDEWEGTFTGDDGSCKRVAFTVRMKLRIATEVIDGKGECINFPPDPSESRGFVVVGNIFGVLTELDLIPEASFFKGMPFTCLGSATPSRNRISGRFKLGCFSGCGCGGGAGDFVFNKLKGRGSW